MADVTALKRRRAAFVASGQTDKVRRIDAEIAALRGAAPADDSGSDEVPDPKVETAQADLDGVETAAAVRRPPARKRKAR